MAASFYFYDLETSGFNPREARIMQFGGQRTDMNLKPIGEPYSTYIKLTDDILPDPDAILVTGITPQKTLSEGITEAEFLAYFAEEIAQPDTIFVGYNTVRFDDEFMRHLHYRNFYDPYEWQWQDGRSRWDLLDVVRMTRALRPEGIKWPVNSDGKPSNTLGLLTSINGLDHANAHDALSDVQATIALAQLIKAKQPKLFTYLLDMRDKKKVAELVNTGQPFVYASGKYDSMNEKATVVIKLADHPQRAGALVYDLRHDSTPFLNLSADKLAELWQWQADPEAMRLPIKTLQFNRCPAVAPLSVLDKASKERLHLDMDAVAAHQKLLQDNPGFTKTVLQALEILDKKQQTSWLQDDKQVDNQLYDGFFGSADKTKMGVVRAASPQELSAEIVSFTDPRLRALLPLYKARNFPKLLTDEERTVWEQFRETKLATGNRFNQFATRLAQLAEQPKLTPEQQFLLEELQLYAQSITP